MNEHFSDRRKIDPSRREATMPDGTPNDNDRVEIGPTLQAFEEWALAGLQAPDLASMRAFRLQRLASELQKRDYGGILLFDPLNIRYASDSTNMQLWNTHNPFRACFVSADGYMIIWDYKNAGTLLTAHNPLIKETRPGGASFFYFSSGDGTKEDANSFAAQIVDVMKTHGGGSKRLAVDKIQIHGLRALEAAGFEVMEGEEVTEKARAIKGPDEILAMRCAMHSCEAAMAEMEGALQAGMSEDEVWAELHKGNIKRGGEWIETRLLASGPRTNPWFQECGPRIIQNGELLAFDTDLIGVYGMCVDISRTWLVGDGLPTDEQRWLYQTAHDHIMSNMELFKPGANIEDITAACKPLPEDCVKGRYSCMAHGVGLCDEWPHVAYPTEERGRFDYELEPGMMLCVEAYVGRDGGREGVKLEDQILITEDGYENLTSYPFDTRLMG